MTNKQDKSAARRRAQTGWRWRLGLSLAALLAGGIGTAHSAPPVSEDELLSTVQTALEQRDFATFEELINWDGATTMRRRMVSFQLRHGFGRPIRSIALEPFPEDGFKVIEERGTLKPNMAVSHQLRVVFDEPDTAYGKPPTDLFLIGREGDAYRIALVVPAKERRPDND